MDKNEKVIEANVVNEAPAETVVVVEKPKGKVRTFLEKHKAKLLILAGVGLAAAGTFAVKAISSKHNDADSQDEAERAEAVEDWYQKSLMEAHNEPVANVDVDYTPVGNEE